LHPHSSERTLNPCDDALFYDWFEGAAGVTSKLVAAGTTELETPPLTRSVYWVRVSNGCGAVFSQAAQVTVGEGKRAAAR